MEKISGHNKTRGKFWSLEYYIGHLGSLCVCLQDI